jgi:hypothetical protein
VICQRTLVVSVITDKLSHEIEKLLETRAGQFKALEKNPTDGFRLTVGKNNIKRQGSSVGTCILTLVQFVRELLVGQGPQSEKEAPAASAESWAGSQADPSESGAYNQSERPDAKAVRRALK